MNIERFHMTSRRPYWCSTCGSQTLATWVKALYRKSTDIAPCSLFQAPRWWWKVVQWKKKERKKKENATNARRLGRDGAPAPPFPSRARLIFNTSPLYYLRAWHRLRSLITSSQRLSPSHPVRLWVRGWHFGKAQLARESWSPTYLSCHCYCRQGHAITRLLLHYSISDTPLAWQFAISAQWSHICHHTRLLIHQMPASAVCV